MGQLVPVQPQAIRVSPGMTSSVKQFVPDVHAELSCIVVEPVVQVIGNAPPSWLAPLDSWSPVSLSYDGQRYRYLGEPSLMNAKLVIRSQESSWFGRRLLWSGHWVRFPAKGKTSPGSPLARPGMPPLPPPVPG